METSSLDKMLGIFALFSDSQPTVGQEEVITLLGCSRATAYRYLKSLCDAGLIAPAAPGSYVLGPRVIEFDRVLRRHDPLLLAARPVIERVSARLKANVMLCSYYDDKVMCIDRIWPDDSVVSSYERGRPMPMFLGATAKSILANLSPYQQKNLMLTHGAEIRAAGLGNDWEEFRARLREWRKAGVYVSYGEVDAGRIGIGAPILGPQGRVAGSFVFILSASRTGAHRVEALAREAKSAAAEISAVLGSDGARSPAALRA
jgi:DNA-binding IclR family transcriptional regulator